MKRILVILFAVIVLASCCRLSGTYVNDAGGRMESQIEYVGKNTCIVSVTVFGFTLKYPGTYRIDNGYVYIHDQKSDMMLRIEDSNTLVKEGVFGESTYIKVH